MKKKMEKIEGEGKENKNVKRMKEKNIRKKNTNIK
jgi:hypothetical protein